MNWESDTWITLLWVWLGMSISGFFSFIIGAKYGVTKSIKIMRDTINEIRASHENTRH